MPQVTLKLSIGTFSVEVTGPEDYAEKKLQELVGRYLSSVKPSFAEARPSAVGIQNLANLLQRKFPRLQSFDQSDPAAIFFPVMPVPMTAPGLLRKKEPLASIIIDRSGAQLYPPGEFTNRVTSLIHVSFVF